jgi:hypothetical protein
MRIVIGASALGWAVCLAIVVVSSFVPLSAPEPLYVLFGGIFLTFAPAIIAHPAREVRGTNVSVTWRDTIRTSPVWLTAAVVAMIVLMLVCIVATPGLIGSDGFSITRAELALVPERYRMLAAFFGVFYVAALHIAVSGSRWWSAWASGNVP